MIIGKPIPKRFLTIMSDAANENDIVLNMNYCRICFESEPPELISPCDCNGTIKWVHRECLETWIKASGSKECEICKKEYNMGVIIIEVVDILIKIAAVITLMTIVFSSNGGEEGDYKLFFIVFFVSMACLYVIKLLKHKC